jgi:Ser/Thr protein kinase RdoA (MazF antagonist)
LDRDRAAPARLSSPVGALTVECGMPHRETAGQDVNAVFPAQSSVLDESALRSRVVDEYAIGPVRSCHFLSRGDADIYRVTTAEASYYLKVYRPPEERARVESEALFVSHLAERGLSVVPAVRRKDGSFASLVVASEGSRPILLFEEAPPALPREPSPEQMECLGKAVARLHDVADADASLYDLPSFDLEAVETERVPHILRFATEEDSALMQAAIRWIRPQLAEIPRRAPEWGICHGDLVLSNVREGADGVSLFDFGSVARTYRGFDLAVIYWSLGRREREKQDARWQALLRGYESIRPRPEELEARLPAFLALRELAFLGGSAATLPLRLGTEPFESTFIHDGFDRIRAVLAAVGA